MQAGNEHRAGTELSSGALMTLPRRGGATWPRFLLSLGLSHKQWLLSSLCRVPSTGRGLPRSQPSSGFGSGENGEVAWAPCQQAFHTGELLGEYGLNPSHLCNLGVHLVLIVHLPHLTCDGRCPSLQRLCLKR